MNQCKIQRDNRANDDNPAQGRPLGLLAAWLEFPVKFTCDTQCDHKDEVVLTLLDWPWRSAARARLHAVAGSANLFKHERERRLGKEMYDEPLSLP